MTMFLEKPLSLVEKKKQQWAKEREELAGLCAPWSSPKESQQSDRPLERNKNVSKLPMASSTEIFRKDNTSPSRRSSLPPLYKNQYNSIDRDHGGETSGYGSDNPNHSFESAQPVPWNQSGYESSSSFKDDRPKWKDKASKSTGRFWDSKENEPPNWVKRGLQTDEEIVVTNTSPAESPQQEDMDPDRPYTGCSSNFNRTYIRGQNVPLDSTELAERERKRQIALAHQEAVRQQLEERERKRKEEKERKIREEREEELRIEKEQEIERRRKEEELRTIREKQERERRRKEAIQEAVEIAEKEAKLEKMKQRMSRQNNHLLSDNCDEKSNVAEIQINVIKSNNNDVMKANFSENLDCDKVDQTPPKEEHEKLAASPRPSVLNNEINNNLELKPKNLNNPKVANEKAVLNNSTDTLNNASCSNNDNGLKYSPSPFQILSTPRTDNLALVLQTPLESLQNMQYAVLMPAGLGASSAIPIAIPVTVATDSGTTPRTENRVLTPTQYRNRNRRLCDSSTQTDPVEFKSDTGEANNQRFVKEKMTNLELNYDNRGGRKERPSRNEDRSVEDRPKWGANRPPTRYLKQSEKDPLYQRRKLRQKMRDVKQYDDKNSSDESQTGSPRTYRKKTYAEKRHSRALWRKSDHFFARNIRMYQTEIVPLESDKEQIYYSRSKCDCCCRCRCSSSRETSKPDILKIDHNSPRDQRNDSLPDCNGSLESTAYILDKLTSLHNGLLLKQEQWEKSPRTPSLSSSTRNTENNS